MAAKLYGVNVPIAAQLFLKYSRKVEIKK